MLTEELVLRRLIYEPTVYPVNGAYRKSFWRSFATVLVLYLKSRRLAAPPDTAWSSATLCFAVFKNELRALEQAQQRNLHWQIVRVSVQEFLGLDWRSVFDPTLRLLLTFLKDIYRLAGWPAVRDFAYPFIGYLGYLHLCKRFAGMSSKPEVVTTNLMHPISVGIHLAALSAGLHTKFWEHAMTPRIVATDLGYSEYYVNCDHTRASFLDAGVPSAAVKLIGSTSDLTPVPLGAGRDLRRIALSVNDLDDLADIERTIRLLKELGRDCVLRVHDSDRRFNALAQLANAHAISLSNAAETPIVQLMDEVDLIIAGNSNVVLDCIREGKRVLYFWPGDPRIFDYYGIAAASRCDAAATFDELAQRLKQCQ